MIDQTESPAAPQGGQRRPCANMGWKIFGVIMSFIFVAVAVAVSSIAWSGHARGTDAAVLPPVVTTLNGRVVGSWGASVFNGKSYVVYKSIPFAKPPLGPLRFMHPQPLEPQSGNQYVNSDSYKPSCWSVTKQSNDASYGEDCLYLNVYVPGDALRSNTQKLYPVMVWIHGGGFVAGNAFPEPIKMVTRGDVIVVSVNYRMGVFGFLTTLDDNLPANNGLWDQHMALLWIKENIRSFAGNDSSITVFGESAGAVSAALLTISPISGKLFHKAILQSGSATTAILSRDAPRRAREFGDMVGCSEAATSIQLSRCLRNASVADILRNSLPSSFNLTAARKQADFIWVPTVDGEFLPQEPLAILSNMTYLKSVGALNKDYIIGILNNEGGLISENFLNKITLTTVGNPGFPSDILDYFLYTRYNRAYTNGNLKDAIYKYYHILPRNVSNPQNVLDMCADLLFTVPAAETALALSGCSVSNALSPLNTNAAPLACLGLSPKVYFYHFDYCGPLSNLNKPQCLVHGAEIALEFPRDNLTDADLGQLSDTFVDLLTTFAHNSTPGSAVSSGWPTFDQFSQLYLRLDKNPSVRLAPYRYRVSFWLDTVSSLLNTSV